MKYVIDHFEEHFAVCEAEDGNTVDIEKTKISKQAKVCDGRALKKSDILNKAVEGSTETNFRLRFYFIIIILNVCR
ncbi:DUF3006 domain-containing protein [Heyndrickxia ginsengihumi]|uniref:DUF3006 domain-containing protein n=1 Tax=Heyndrickxia ginsengihumi TaxID=363870 RepID=UPI0020423832|nr:DUF3006 domain-containing protein [Heyndrickxia ginsengihumi]MCM3022578.1 DUF3006 domain-containing protein [Heyndrickxia ginsengihumi]